MSVKIRLSRIGKKHAPFYRIVAVDSRKKRDGACIENIGTFDGLATKVVVFHEERYNDWISKGALPSDATKKIYKLYKKNAAEKQ
jgi:small subunit ribosomal protein S16